MKKHNLFIRFLLAINIHNWKYSGSSLAPNPGDTRTCKWTGRNEIYIFDIGNGMADGSYWDINEAVSHVK